jgi:hypothetical protein
MPRHCLPLALTAILANGCLAPEQVAHDRAIESGAAIRSDHAAVARKVEPIADCLSYSDGEVICAWDCPPCCGGFDYYCGDFCSYECVEIEAPYSCRDECPCECEDEEGNCVECAAP